MKTGVILVAAGEGRRFGGPKAFVDLDGRTLVERAAAPFAGFPDRVVVLREADLDRAPAGWTAVAGGARRRDSVARGLDALGPDTRLVLIHDAARPLVPRAVIARVAGALAPGVDAVVPGVPVTDTIKRVDGGRVAETLDRATLRAIQTPQGYPVDVLRQALAASATDATDEAALVEARGGVVVVVDGDPRNLKITGPEDLAIAAALL